MKLLLVWHAGGVQSYWKRIEELAKKFDEVLLVVPKNWNEGGKDVITSDTTLLPNCKIKAIQTRLNRHGALYFYSMKFRKLIKDFKPDIVHIHEEPWSISALQTIFLCKQLRLNAKFVIDSAAINLKKMPVFSSIEKYVMRNSSLIFARNNECREILVKRGCSLPICILPNGVDPELFKAADISEIENIKSSYNVPAGHYIVAFIGRMIREKGIFDFVDSSKSLLDSLNKPIHFLMVGNGPEKENVKKKVQELGLENSFTFIDKVPSTQVPLIMNALDILVLPSISTTNWKEQFGRVLVEAMACGKAVIGSSSGGIPEVIGDQQYVFVEGNSNQLTRIAEQLISNSELLDQAKKHGRKRVDTLYSWSAISENYKQVLLEHGIV